MFLVEIEIPKKNEKVHLFTKKVEVKEGDWCTFKQGKKTKIGRVSLVLALPPENTRGKERTLRKAEEKEIEEFYQHQGVERKAYAVAQRQIALRNLPMKLISTEYPLGEKKIIFYFTSKKRVDFRGLVKDLASVFRMRIELRQIGVRDEVSISGGFGICGRPVCCWSFLKKDGEKLNSVGLEMAKLQNLPLTPSKISGLCGRLRCCLNFEFPYYHRVQKELPQIGDTLILEGEDFKVVEVNYLKEEVTVENEEGVRRKLKKEEIPR